MTYDEHSQEHGSPKYKSRYWCGICWIENMVEEWREIIGDVYGLPGFYGLHDKDVDSKGVPRKPHAHVTLCWDGPTTRKNAKEVFNLLSAPGKVCCSTANFVPAMRGCFDYAIHDTDTARKQGKYQYPETARVTFNGFEIGFFEHLSAEEKDRMSYDIAKLIGERKIEEMETLRQIIFNEYDFRYFQVFKNQNAFFDRLCRGVYLRRTNGVIEITEQCAMLDPAKVAMSDLEARTEEGVSVAVCQECGEIKTKTEFDYLTGVNIGVCKTCQMKIDG